MAEIGGVLAFTDNLEPAKLVDHARRLEALGYPEMWLPDLLGRELFTLAGYLLSHTTRLRVGTGIANVYGRDALSTAQGARTLSELYDGRFVLGLGVSHPQVAEMRGHTWVPPARKLRAYLEDMAAASARSPQPAARAPIYIAAHGPKLLGVAAEHADGANTYLMPPEHTREAREILGPNKVLNVVLPCCLCEDAEVARTTGRRGLSTYMELPAYRIQWARFGFDEGDFGDGGSERLIDEMVAWGDEAAIRRRIRSYLDAGANRIIVLPYALPKRSAASSGDVLEALAPGVD